MNLPGMFSPSGLRRPEDPTMATFLATPEGRKLMEEAAEIERTQMGMPPQPAAVPAVPAAPDPTAPPAANPFASLLGTDSDVLKALLGGSAAPPRQPKTDPWDLLLHLGPALMQAGSRPGASFLGSVGEGLGSGMKAAQAARRDALTSEQQDRLYNLQRAKLGVDLAQTMKKSTKAPTVQEFYDEKTGLPYKAQYDEKSDSWRRIGGVKTGDEKGVKTQLVPVRQPDGSVQQTLVDMRTGEPIRTIGAPDPRPDGKTALVKVQQPDGSVQQVLIDMATGQTIQNIGSPSVKDGEKPPEGFRYVDPADPKKGVELIPGFQRGKAALAAPQRLPEGYQPIDPADPSKGMRLIPGYLDGKRQIAGAGTKPPEGFVFIDPANPAAGVTELRGFAEGRARQEALKPFTLPENATRVAPAGAGTPSPYAQNTKAFENTTGNPAARNPNSTATGDGQFLEGTWRDLWPKIAQDAAPILMKKGIDPARLTPQQILDLRKDPDVSAVAIDTFANANRPALRSVLGRDPDAGELQTAHMFGAAGASQILQAPPQTPIQQIVSPEVYAANERFLAGKTAADVVNHFRQRQGRGQGIANAPQSAPPPSRPGQASTAPGYQVIAQGASVPRVDNAYDAARGKDLAAARQALSDDADSARDVVNSIQNIRGLLEIAGDTSKLTPATTEMKAYAKALGIDLERLGIKDNVGVMQAASAEIKKLILPFFQQTKGAITERENKLFAEMTARPENDPEANRIILELAFNVARRKMRLDEMAVDYENKNNGRLDAGWRRVVNEFYRKEGITGEGLVPGVPGPPTRASAPPSPGPAPRGLARPEQPPVAAPGTATAAPPTGPAPRGAPKSLAPQIKMMDIGTLQQLVPEALSPEDRKAAADRWEELNRGAR